MMEKYVYILNLVYGHFTLLIRAYEHIPYHGGHVLRKTPPVSHQAKKEQEIG